MSRPVNPRIESLPSAHSLGRHPYGERSGFARVEGREADRKKKVAPEFSETPPCFNARGYSALRFCAHLGAPLIKTMLDPVDDISHNHPADRKDQDADKD